mmetsp:Transcript_9792/g.59575  ORF Transcript_9792/g.59575 Transcript_9792/m.59575 type:complete len:205 (+) Transcript_9792:1902-2516(+)
MDRLKPLVLARFVRFHGSQAGCIRIDHASVVELHVQVHHVIRGQVVLYDVFDGDLICVLHWSRVRFDAFIGCSQHPGLVVSAQRLGIRLGLHGVLFHSSTIALFEHEGRKDPYVILVFTYHVWIPLLLHLFFVSWSELQVPFGFKTFHERHLQGCVSRQQPRHPTHGLHGICTDLHVPPSDPSDASMRRHVRACGLHRATPMPA